MDKQMDLNNIPDPVPGNKPKRRVRVEKGRNPYDGLRPWSAITHSAGIALGLLAAPLLLMRAVTVGPMWYLAPFLIYLVSMIGLYTASTLYHCLNTGVAGRIALRKYDHISIYFLIAGSYTPICLISLHGALGYTMLSIIWALTLGGTVMSLLWINAPRWVTSGIYLFMGWMAIFAIVPLAKLLPPAGLFYLLLGGVLYTVGGVLYAVKWPGRNNPRFGCHEIFHLFILLGSIVHFLMMYRVIVYL